MHCPKRTIKALTASSAFWLKCLLMIGLTLAPVPAAHTWADSTARLEIMLRRVTTSKDAVMVASPDDKVLVSIHADRLLIPASILKLVTVSAAIDQLGETFRFKTDFYQDDSGNLIIKGYGDPLLISERIAVIAEKLAGRLSSFRQLILDDSYFADGIVIPGRSSSEEPYDAPNGALCVNFNTVAFRKDNGRWVSGEPQTPLLPAVVPKIEASGLKTGRITLAADSTEALEYTGGLFHYFFGRAGLPSDGGVRPGRARIEKDRLIWQYQSLDDLGQASKDLLEFSNNFIANQILLVMGAEVLGPPATIQKGLKVLRRYCQNELGMRTGSVVEASGISRKNRISARTMMNTLVRLEPYYQLLRHDNGRQFYKTGHLKGIRTRAGYITRRNGGRYRFVVILNTPGRQTHPIMRILERELK